MFADYDQLLREDAGIIVVPTVWPRGTRLGTLRGNPFAYEDCSR